LNQYPLAGTRLCRAGVVLLSLSPSVLLLQIPLCLLVSVIQRDTAGINGTGQPLDNYMTVTPTQKNPPALFGRRLAGMESYSRLRKNEACPLEIQ
jgi:hypothetical protein